jgi:hypothetical protein
MNHLQAKVNALREPHNGGDSTVRERAEKFRPTWV